MDTRHERPGEEFCGAEVEHEPEPCAGSLVVRCGRPKGHGGEHQGSVESHEFLGADQAGVEVTCRWRAKA